MPQLTNIIRGVRQTEKGTRLAALRQYVLEVDPRATKPAIRKAAQALFGVTVEQVTTQRIPGKWRRLSGRWGKHPAGKKAIVTVAQGQKIEIK